MPPQLPLLDPPEILTPVNFLCAHIGARVGGGGGGGEGAMVCGKGGGRVLWGGGGARGIALAKSIRGSGSASASLASTSSYLSVLLD